MADARALFTAAEAPAPARARDLVVRLAGPGDAALVKAFVRAHHSLLPSSPAGWRAAFIASSAGGDVWAVATWGRPTARHAEQAHTIELTRLCARNGSPKNTCSYLMAASRRTLRRLYPHLTDCISYQDCDAHTGGIYRADNWVLAYDCQERGTASWGSRAGRANSERSRRAKWTRRLA